MSKRLQALGALALLCISGCSGRYTSYVVGNVNSLTVPSEHNANTPLILVGQAQFMGDFQNPVLTVVYPSSSGNVIKVSAVASPKEPLMGWGVFRGQGSQAAEVRGSILLEKPGQYIVESIPREAGMPSTRATLTIR